MKKILIVVMVIAMTAALASCTLNDGEKPPVKETSYSTEANSSKDTSKEETNAPAKENKETESQKVTFGLNETAVFENLKFTATELKESNGGDTFFIPDSGNVFVGIKFIVENISEEEQSVSSILLFDGYVDDIKCSYSISANCIFDEGTIDGTVVPGKKLIGWYALEVPEDWSTIELQVQQTWLSDNSATFVFEK